MVRKQYKTARGKRFDMGELAHANETSRAVGNMNVNARGDVLGQGGHIKKTREEVVRDYYHEGPPQETEVSLKKETTSVEDAIVDDVTFRGPVDTFVSPEEAIQTLLDQQKGTSKPQRGGKVKTNKIKDGSEYSAPARKKNNDSNNS